MIVNEESGFAVEDVVIVASKSVKLGEYMSFAATLQRRTWPALRNRHNATLLTATCADEKFARAGSPTFANLRIIATTRFLTSFR